MRQASAVTVAFLRKFKSGDLVDVREVKRNHRTWTGPHKILSYKLDPQAKGATPAAHISVDLGHGTRLERWLIVGEHQIIRHHVAKD